MSATWMRDHRVALLSPLSYPAAVSAKVVKKEEEEWTERRGACGQHWDNRGGLIRVSVTDSVVNKPAINWRPPQLNVIVGPSSASLSCWWNEETKKNVWRDDDTFSETNVTLEGYPTILYGLRSSFNYFYLSSWHLLA